MAAVPLLVSLSAIAPHEAGAGGFFQTGRVTLTDTVDGGLWVTVPLTKPFVNPVVLSGALTHNNDLGLSVRVRNVSATSFQIGMQSPCESAGQAAPGVVCPPIGGFVSETATYWVVEEGVWEFPDGTEIESGIHNTSTVRANGGIGGSNNASDQVNYLRTSFATAPAVLHQVNSVTGGAGLAWITTAVWGSGTNRNTQPTTTGFRLALEGAEVNTSHTAEDIGWVAMEAGAGTNNGLLYDIGLTAGRVVDRHNDLCLGIGSYSVGADPLLTAQMNTMSGGNGGWLRQCGLGVQPTSIDVHVDEDQVNDIELTGNTEAAAWFAFESASFGNLDFLTATQTATDDDGGTLEPGDTITYAVSVVNELSDFAQADNAGAELIIPLPAGTTVVGGSLTASSGTLTENGGANRLEWNGSVAASGTVTLGYRLMVDSTKTVCGTDISSQATLLMDPNGDGLNAVTELSDDALIDDAIDIDADGATDDDDPNVLSVVCSPAPTLTIMKTASSGAAAPGDTVLYTVTVANTSAATATSVELEDDLSEYVAFGLDTFGAGVPFQLTDSGSGLSLGAPQYSDDDGATFTYTPVSGGGGAPAGYDANVTHWFLPMSGTMSASPGSFVLRYRCIVE